MYLCNELNSFILAAFCIKIDFAVQFIGQINFALSVFFKAVSELQTLTAETLSNKDGTAVLKILSVSLTSPNMKTQIPEGASMDPPPSSVSEPPQNVCTV